jgi:hypothetical protein
MIRAVILFTWLLFWLPANGQHTRTGGINNDSSAVFIKGNFTDDYGIRYTVTDSQWVQHPGAIYHILKWNKQEQYIIAKNDKINPSEGGLYTRIDYMAFTGMQPWLWGFCFTSYNAVDSKTAEAAITADRKNPKKGCGGFPFSRMKPTD